MNTSEFKKTVTIDGYNFADFETFYNEIDRVCTRGLTWKTGHNLNAFNDLLRGGFGVYDFEEPFNLVWINFERSKQLMGEEHIGWLVEIISKHDHIQFSTFD
jgi:RNAse (barnase) inhibitor barstar